MTASFMGIHTFTILRSFSDAYMAFSVSPTRDRRGARLLEGNHSINITKKAGGPDPGGSGIVKDGYDR